MKKILSILIAILLVFGVCACNEKAVEETIDTKENEPEVCFETTKDDITEIMYLYAETYGLNINLVDSKKLDTEYMDVFWIKENSTSPLYDSAWLFYNENGNITGLDLTIRYILDEATQQYKIPLDNYSLANNLMTELTVENGSVKEYCSLVDVLYPNDAPKTVKDTKLNINYFIDYKNDKTASVTIFPKGKEIT